MLILIFAIVILCEYAHAMGNSSGGLSKYWELFRDSNLPRMQGGFIWDLVDQSLMLPNNRGYGYGGEIIISIPFNF